MRGLLDPNAGYRNQTEWRRLLSGLVDSLSTFDGTRFSPTSWLVQDDKPGYASASNCVDIRGIVSPVLRLSFMTAPPFVRLAGAAAYSYISTIMHNWIPPVKVSAC